MMHWRKVILSVFGVCMLAASIAEALPLSTHYYGSTDYSFTEGSKVLSGEIDFAVYDTQSGYDEFVGYDSLPLTPPGDGRYIYAYQIFNDDGFANVAVEYFAIVQLRQSEFSGISAATGGDPSAVSPQVAYFTPDSTNPSKAIYMFNNSTLIAGKYSSYLIFTSNQDWVKGDYEIRGEEVGDNQDFPVPEVPEPATLALLSAGTILGLRLKRRMRKV